MSKQTKQDKLLAAKQQGYKNLLTILELNNRILTEEEHQYHENEQSLLEFDLANLVIESKIKEMDIKIKHLTNIIQMLKHERPSTE